MYHVCETALFTTVKIFILVFYIMILCSLLDGYQPTRVHGVITQNTTLQMYYLLYTMFERSRKGKEVG